MATQQTSHKTRWRGNSTTQATVHANKFIGNTLPYWIISLRGQILFDNGSESLNRQFRHYIWQQVEDERPIILRARSSSRQSMKWDHQMISEPCVMAVYSDTPTIQPNVVPNINQALQYIYIEGSVSNLRSRKPLRQSSRHRIPAIILTALRCRRKSLFEAGACPQLKIP